MKDESIEETIFETRLISKPALSSGQIVAAFIE